MIRSLYVDNFRSLVDFTWMPGKEVLMLGYNGSGKSTVLDALLFLQKWCTGEARLDDVITPKDRTQWLDRDVCRFRLDLETGGSIFHYVVDIQIGKPGYGNAVAQERLWVDDEKRGFHREGGNVYLDPQGGYFPLHQQQSVFSIIDVTDADTTIGAFLGELSRFIIVRPAPPLMVAESVAPNARPEISLSNLISWLQTLIDHGGFVSQLQNLLSVVWTDFKFLRLVRVGTTARVLEFSFGSGAPQSTAAEVNLGMLSDGEQMLVALYALAAVQRTFPATTIIIDEPDNFVALSELQPWLLTVLDDRPDDGQLILVSHNSEIIQTMGESKVAFFSRDDHLSPTKVGTLQKDDTGLSLSERVALGWIDA
jgi:energy-coupling factor transporter ATP-binding protein EcfA2